METGLYYNRFRYYDPEDGVYVSQDPIGLEGDNPNIYAFVFDSNTEVDIFGLRCIKNKLDGIAREKEVQQYLERFFGKGNVLRERLIRGVDRKKVTDLLGSGRRVDFVILVKGKAKYLVEVTSKTANKALQEAKEVFIRKNGGDFIKMPGRNGKLIDIKNAISKTIRLK